MNIKNGKEGCSCQVESLVSIDERGQMVLPKELRDRAKIKPGDKLAVVAWEKDGEICCLSLIKTDNFNGVLANLLGPMIKEISEIKV
jgi:AbrB family looped-hinge helix DNA binding protein